MNNDYTIDRNTTTFRVVWLNQHGDVAEHEVDIGDRCDLIVAEIQIRQPIAVLGVFNLRYQIVRQIEPFDASQVSLHQGAVRAILNEKTTSHTNDESMRGMKLLAQLSCCRLAHAVLVTMLVSDVIVVVVAVAVAGAVAGVSSSTTNNSSSELNESRTISSLS
jgi:hypothetical protein